MKNFFKTIQKDSIASWSFWTTSIFILLMIATILVTYRNLPPFLPLYNQMPWGYDRLGKIYELFFLPGSLFIILCINTGVGLRFIQKIPLLARFLFITMIVLSVFTYIFLVRIILLVI